MDLSTAYVHVHLDELIDLARRAGRSWCTLEEYARVTHPDRDRFPFQGEAVRRHRFRLAAVVRRMHLELRMETVEGELHLHVVDPTLVCVIERGILEARAIVERREARALPVTDAEEDEPMDAAQVVADYRGKLLPFSWVERRWRAGYGRVRRIVEAVSGVRTPSEAQRLEARRHAHLVTSALEAADAGEPVSRVAAILGCTEQTAREVLRRHGREPQRLGRGARWRLCDRRRTQDEKS